jgi:hypothetical protein
VDGFHVTKHQDFVMGVITNTKNTDADARHRFFGKVTRGALEIKGVLFANNAANRGVFIAKKIPKTFAHPVQMLANVHVQINTETVPLADQEYQLTDEENSGDPIMFQYINLSPGQTCLNLKNQSCWFIHIPVIEKHDSSLKLSEIVFLSNGELWMLPIGKSAGNLSKGRAVLKNDKLFISYERWAITDLAHAEDQTLSWTAGVKSDIKLTYPLFSGNQGKVLKIRRGSDEFKFAIYLKDEAVVGYIEEFSTAGSSVGTDDRHKNYFMWGKRETTMVKGLYVSTRAYGTFIIEYGHINGYLQLYDLQSSKVENY